MPTLRAAEGVPIVTGVPVNASRRANDYDDYEDVSTDQMQSQTSGRPPIVRGHRISDLRQQASHSPTSQRMMACLNVVSGIILPYMAYYYYLQYGDRMCSKPVAGWLYTYAMVSATTGIIGLWANFKQLGAIAQLQRAQALPEGPEKEQATAEAMITFGSIGCIVCCILFPLGVFSFFWWVKGNFDVWGTYPRTDIRPDEPWADFKGCDADLLNAARTIYFWTYGIILFSCFSFCAVMGVVLAAAEEAAGEARAEELARRPQHGAAML